MASVSGEIVVSGSSTVEPISTGVAEAFAAANPDFNFTVDGPGHRRRLQAVLRRRDRHLRRLAHDQGRGGRGLRRRRHRVRRAQGRHRRHLRPDVRQQHRRRLPQLRGPLRPDRPRVRRLREVERRGGHRQGARLQHRRSPTRTSTITGPGEESGTFDSFVELAIAEDRRGARPGAQHPPRLHGLGQRQRDHRRHRGLATPRSAGWASPSPRRTRTRSARSRSPRTPTASASPRRRRPSPTAPTRCPAPCSST